MKSPKEFLTSLARMIEGELHSDLPLIELAEGQAAEVECARSGKFVDMNGRAVTFTPETLTELAGTLDAEEAPVKIGHVPIETTTPDYGRVASLRYDAEKDRLFATVEPTPALVRKNREEGFRRVSMELSAKDAESPFNFRALAFLAARKPAIRGLAPVELAAAEGEQAFVFADGDGELDFHFRQFDAKARKADAKSGAAMPDGSFPIENETDLENAIKAVGRAKDPEAAKAHIRKRAQELGCTDCLPASWKGAVGDLTHLKHSEATTDNTEKGDQVDEETKAKFAAQEAENKRLREKIAETAFDQADAFLSAHKGKIPMTLHKAGVRAVLASAIALEATEVVTLKFSVGEGDEKKDASESPATAIKRILAALPELVSEEEKTESGKKGVEEETEKSEFADKAGFDQDSVAVDFAARKLMKESKAKGQEITYRAAVEMVQSRKQ